MQTRSQCTGKKSFRSRVSWKTILNVDSDAVVHTSPQAFASAIGNHDFLLSDDPSLDHRKLFLKLKPFNAGVWAVRNTEKGSQIMSDWKESYDPTKWSKDDDGSWSCGMFCEWAGVNYEQGAFWNIIDKHKKDMQHDSWRVWNNLQCTSRVPEGAHVCHFMGDTKRNISDYVSGNLSKCEV